MRLRRSFGWSALLGLAAAPVAAQQIDVIFCEIPTSPKSVVPGALDLAGQPAQTNWKSLENLYSSADGTRWMAGGRTQQGTDLENILVLGSGTSSFLNFAQEGQPIPGGAPGELYDFFGSGVGRFNSLNQFAYSARARGGVAAVFQKVLFWNGSTYTLRMQMGDLYTGLVDLAPNPSGDEIIGNSIGSIHVLDSGVIGSQDSTIGNIHTSRRPAIFLDNAAFHQTGVTSVNLPGGAGTSLWATISANTFYSSFDGAHWVAAGRVTAATTADDVLVFDGDVVLQEGSLVPGSSLAMGSVLDSGITGQGTWYARGRDNSGTTAVAPDWFVRQGVLLAETDAPIGGGESFGDTFLGVAINDNGDWAMACNTDAVNPAANEVLIVNGQVILREGDPVDVDGNGQFDDGAFIGRGTNTLAAFGANKLRLSDDGIVWVVVHLNDGMGNDLGSVPAFGTPDAFLRIDLGLGCIAPSVYCTAKMNSAGCVPQIAFSGTPSASAPSGFTVSASNELANQLGVFFYGVTGPAVIAFQGGTLCATPPVIRTPPQSSGVGATCAGTYNVDFNAWIAGGNDPALIAGTEVWGQFWSRDPGDPFGTNLTDAVHFQICP